MNTDKKEDPYVHFLKSGCPNGEWSYDVIKPSAELLSVNKELKVSLHIHVHYPELLTEILKDLEVTDAIQTSILVAIIVQSLIQLRRV